MRKKVHIKLQCKDIYNYYIKNLDEIEKNNGYNISHKLFRKTLSKINDRIMNHIVIDREPYIMPVIRFELSVKKRKTINGIMLLKNGNSIRFGSVDWKRTKDLWKSDKDAKKSKKLIFHLNNHTDGYTYFIDVRHHFPYIRNNIYEFKAVRKYRRLLAKQLLNNEGIDAYTVTKKQSFVGVGEIESKNYM